MKAPLVLLWMSIGWLTGCGASARKAEDRPAGATVSVKTVTVAMEAWPEEYEATGTVRARTAAVVSSRVMGYVREVRVQLGDHVREGQLLVALDAADLDANCRRAKAGGEEARSAIPEADNGVAAADANVELARVTFTRMKDLFASKSVSNQEYDEAAARLKAAEAAHAMAQSKRAQLTARIAQADELLRSAEIQCSYAQMHAPFAGVVTAKSVEPGNLATPGTPLVTVEREGAFRLEVQIEESRLAAIRSGQPVTVAIDALGGAIAAKVGEVVPAVDAASRAYLVKIDLPQAAQLRSGTFGRAKFSLRTRQTLIVPAAAVTERGQLQSVFVVEEGTARTRIVTAGSQNNGRAEVLSGLSVGEKVIVPVPSTLTDGVKVEVRE